MADIPLRDRLNFFRGLAITLLHFSLKILLGHLGFFTLYRNLF